MKDELLKARPTYGFLGEESDEIKGTDGAHRWIVDPLDGTTNFLHGIPQSPCRSRSKRNGEIVAAVVFNPATDELYTAEKGGGAFLNDRRPARGLARKELSDSEITCAYRASRPVATTASFSLNCAMSWANRRDSPFMVLPRSTSPMSLPVAATAIGKPALPPGTSQPAFSSSREAGSLVYRFRWEDQHAGDRLGRRRQRIHPQGSAEVTHRPIPKC